MKIRRTLLLFIFSLSISTPIIVAQDLYFDTFTDPDGTLLNGRAPEVNNGPAGAVYQKHNGGWITDIQGNVGRVGADSGATLVVKGQGLVPSSTLHISGQLDVNDIAGPTTSSNTGVQRGLGLGYWSSVGSVATNGGWRGVQLGTDGRLILSQHGVAGSSRAGFVAEIATGINTAVPHQLSYDVNLVSGDISNIVFDNAAQADIATSLFSGASITQAGMMVSSAAGNTYGLFDNFSVQTQGEQVPGIYGTGVDASGNVLAQGSADPHWTITSGPGVTPGAATVQLNNGAWLANDAVGTPGSSWISTVDSGNTNIAPGDYTFETTFDLTGYSTDSMELALQIASDNSAAVFLNGNPTGITQGGFAAFGGPFYIDSGFLSGLNTLEVVLNNAGTSPNPGGLRVELTGYAQQQVPEPASIAIWSLIGLGLAGFGYYRTRRKK